MSKPPISALVPGNQPYSAERFNRENPITRALIYQGGMELIRESTTEHAKRKPGKKQKIRGLSRRSLNRLAFIVFTSPTEFKSIITLTYGTPHPIRGDIIKKQLKYFLTDMFRAFGSFAYCWWLEFQTRREAPHFHLLTTLPAPDVLSLQRFGELWAKWAFWNVEMRPGEYEKVLKVHSFRQTNGSKKRQAWEGVKRQNGAKWYILKYASKHTQKAVPASFKNVGRFWGVSSKVKRRDFQEVEVTEEEVREFLNSKALSVTKREILPKQILIPK